MLCNAVSHVYANVLCVREGTSQSIPEERNFMRALNQFFQNGWQNVLFLYLTGAINRSFWIHMFIRELCRFSREDSRYSRLATRNTRIVHRARFLLSRRPERCVLTFGFIYFARVHSQNGCISREASPAAVLRFGQESGAQVSILCNKYVPDVFNCRGFPIAVYGQWQISGCPDNGRFSGAPNASDAADNRNERRPPLMRACLALKQKTIRLFILLMRLIVKRGRNLALLPVKKNVTTSTSLG